MKDLRNKVVLITGAGGGIGLNTAGFFAEAKSRLVLTDINELALENADGPRTAHVVGHQNVCIHPDVVAGLDGGFASGAGEDLFSQSHGRESIPDSRLCCNLGNLASG